MAAAKQMKVKMVNRLPAFISRIDDHPISLGEFLGSRQVRRRRQKMTQQRRMRRQSLGLRGQMLFGND